MSSEQKILTRDVEASVVPIGTKVTLQKLSLIHIFEVAEPVQLIYISSAKQNGEVILPRNLVIAEANSKLTVVESYISTGNAAYFTNTVTEILAGDHAVVEHVKLQDEAADAFHIATIAGEFGRASNVTVHSFALGAKLSRTNIRAKLAGEGLECILNGLYLTKDEQLADHHMIVAVSYTHLDVYKRQVFHDAADGRDSNELRPHR